MNKMLFFFFSFSMFSHFVIAQDTVRLKKQPKVIIKSWYPEYKDFPKLKIGKRKIIFTIISELDRNDVNLKTANRDVEIQETTKENQFWITVNQTNAKNVEVWLDIGDKIILINQNGKWKNASELYKLDGKRILIDKVKLDVIK